VETRLETVRLKENRLRKKLCQMNGQTKRFLNPPESGLGWFKPPPALLVFLVFLQCNLHYYVIVIEFYLP